MRFNRARMQPPASLLGTPSHFPGLYRPNNHSFGSFFGVDIVIPVQTPIGLERLLTFEPRIPVWYC
jgi:hypothetical protein